MDTRLQKLINWCRSRNVFLCLVSVAVFCGTSAVRSETPSIYDLDTSPGNTLSFDFVNPYSASSMDLRVFEHYYVGPKGLWRQPAQLVLVPVKVRSYYVKNLKATTSASPTPTTGITKSSTGNVDYALMMSTFNDFSSGSVGRMGDPEVLVANIPPPTKSKIQSEVVIARRIGTSDFSMFLYQFNQ